MSKKTGRLFLMLLVMILVVSLAGCGAKPTGPAKESFPTRPIELETCFGPGGGVDQMARIMAPEMEKVLGQPIQISNTSGASGDTGLARAMAQKADGYTIAYQNSNSIMRMALGKSPFKREQFDYVCRAHVSEFWLFINANDKRFNDWDGVVKYAKANPGKLTVAVEGLGAEDELFIKFLADKGIDLKIVPYAAPGERYTALVGGHEDLMLEQIGDVVQYVTGKQIKPILVFSKERIESFPDVPCSFEKGLELDLKQLRIFLVKAGTPKDRVAKIAEAFKAAYDSPAYQEALKKWHVDPQTAWMGPEELSRFIDQELKVLAELGRKYGLGK